MLCGQWYRGADEARRTVNASESSKDSRCQTTTWIYRKELLFLPEFRSLQGETFIQPSVLKSAYFSYKKQTCHPQSSKTMLPPPNKDGVLCSAFLGAGATPLLHLMSCLPLCGQAGSALESLAVKASETKSVSNPSFRPCEDPPQPTHPQAALTCPGLGYSSF